MANYSAPGAPGSAPRAPLSPQLAPPADLLVAAGRERTVLISGFLAGVGVFFAPLLTLGVALLAAYLAYLASDGTAPVFALGRPLEAADFRAVFAPAVNEAPLLLSAGLLGAMLAQFRRRLVRRADPSCVAAGMRPFFPEFALLYALLVSLVLVLAATRGGWPQVYRLIGAAPVFLLFMLGATWLAHAVWQYCFRSMIDLLASSSERDAAAALGGRARRLGSHQSTR